MGITFHRDKNIPIALAPDLLIEAKALLNQLKEYEEHKV